MSEKPELKLTARVAFMQYHKATVELRQNGVLVAAFIIRDQVVDEFLCIINSHAALLEACEGMAEQMSLPLVLDVSAEDKAAYDKVWAKGLNAIRVAKPEVAGGNQDNVKQSECDRCHGIQDRGSMLQFQEDDGDVCGFDLCDACYEAFKKFMEPEKT